MQEKKKPVENPFDIPDGARFDVSNGLPEWSEEAQRALDATAVAVQARKTYDRIFKESQAAVNEADEKLHEALNKMTAYHLLLPAGSERKRVHDSVEALLDRELPQRKSKNAKNPCLFCFLGLH